MKLTTVVLLLALLGLAASRKKKGSKKRRDPCPASATSCSECISANPACAWCSGQSTNNAPPCQKHDKMVKSGTCSAKDIMFPLKSNVIIMKNVPTSRKRPIGPQIMEVELRRGASETISIDVVAQKSSLSLKFKHPRAVKLKVKSNCKGFTFNKKMAECRGIKKGLVKFILEVKLKRCLPKPKKIKVLVDGIKKKSLKITVKSKCQCDCDRPEQVAPYSPECSEHGTLACGLCQCESGFYGRHCECGEHSEDMCRTSSTGPVCSGRGTCVCGVCNCNSVSNSSVRSFSGRYCECDDTNCPYFEGQVCGGVDRGVCRCGRCLCNIGYTGDSCQESHATDGCLTPSGTICSNNGKCLNNQCVCGKHYAGRLCESCPHCPGQCAFLKPCIQCWVYKTGPFDEEECQNECSYMETAEFRDDVGIRDPTEPELHQCMFRDDDDCFFKFAYRDNEVHRREIFVEPTKACN